jgi:hypothetical protein
MSLPATRLQQAERVRNTVRLLQAPLSRARLKRTFKQHPDKVIARLSRAYPMHQLYQVRPLALYDKTYAGCVGVIASYLPSGGVSFMVLYDRPGHAYTNAQERHVLDPQWIDAVTLVDFEEIVKKDNPAVLVA